MYRFLVRYFLIIFIFLITEKSYSQGSLTIQEDVERKISISPYAWVAIFPSLVNFNGLDIPQSVYQGFSPAPLVGCAVYYKLKNRVYLGVDANFFATERKLGGKTINFMNVIGVGPIAKITLLKAKSKFNPYLVVGLNVSFLNISQIADNVTSIPTDTAALGEGSNASLILKRYPAASVTMAPMIGPVAGIGFDVKITRRVSFFAQGTIHTHFANSPLVKNNFDTDPNSVLQFLSLRGGVNIKLYKNMKFDIDSEAVRIPDAIALLSPFEEQEQQAQLLSREANFAVNLREGLKHNVQIGSSSGEINMEVDQDTTKHPCPVLAVLYDQFGNKIAEQKPSADGKVNFKGLDKGVFNVAFEVQPPCSEADFAYRVTDPDADVQKQYNTEQSVDSLAYNIEGSIDFKDMNASKENIQVMLVDQTNKKIKAKMTTTSDGSFAFKNLTPGNYKVVYDVKDAKIQSKIAYDIKTNKDSLVKEVNFPFNEVRKDKVGSRLMSGKIETGDAAFAAYKVNLDLVDKYNRIIDKSVPNPDGSFAFIDNKNDENEILYDLSDRKETDKPLEIKTVGYEAKVEEAQKLEKIAKAAEVAPKEVKKEPEMVKEEIQMYKLYNSEGKALTQEGFGFQVGAFRNMANVNQLMDKLKSEGFEVFVQSVMSNEVNARFKTSQNYKFNRVIVFGTNEVSKSENVRIKLVEEGYTIIVKEHFKPN